MKKSNNSLSMRVFLVLFASFMLSTTSITFAEEKAAETEKTATNTDTATDKKAEDDKDSKKKKKSKDEEEPECE